MKAELPKPNLRIREIIKQKAGGNVLRFVNMLNEGKEEGFVSQQKVNRLFNLDTRTDKYPSVPHDVLEAILTRFMDVDPLWLVTGVRQGCKTDSFLDPAGAGKDYTILKIFNKGKL